MGRVTRGLCGAALALAVVAALASAAQAQVLGTFCWRLEPADQFGEIVTFSVAGQGAVFVLSGFDDRPAGQGGGRFATAGTAFQRPDGQFGLGFTTVFDTFTTHTSAVISLPSLSGTWSDDGGNTGQFVRQAACPQ
jgi:hypothetical protein